MTRLTEISVGRTRSGKLVCCPIRTDDIAVAFQLSRYKTAGDWLDVIAILEFLVSRELRRERANDGFVPPFRQALVFVLETIEGNLSLAKERENLGVATVFDLMKHGKKLVHKDFSD